MRNEIFSADIQTVKISAFFHISLDIVTISGATRGLTQDGNLVKRGPLASAPKRNLRNDGESGRWWL